MDDFWVYFPVELRSLDPLVFAQLINLLHSLQGLAALHLHHGIQALLLLRQLHLDLFLLLDLGVTCGLTLSAQNQLRGPNTQTDEILSTATMIEKFNMCPQLLPTLLSFLISSSCSILKALARSTKRCARSRASSSSSVSAWFSLRDRSAS